MVEIGDQLAEDPGLIWITDPSMFVFDARFGHDLPSGQMPKRDLPRFLGVDGYRTLDGRRRDLIGNGQDGVEAVDARQIQVALDLVDAKHGAGGLDLNEAHPARL